MKDLDERNKYEGLKRLKSEKLIEKYTNTPNTWKCLIYRLVYTCNSIKQYVQFRSLNSMGLRQNVWLSITFTTFSSTNFATTNFGSFV